MPSGYVTECAVPLEYVQEYFPECFWEEKVKAFGLDAIEMPNTD
jgi:hypothetical protein